MSKQSKTPKAEDAQFDQALDWLTNWAMAIDARVPRLFFQICDGEITVDEAEASL